MDLAALKAAVADDTTAKPERLDSLETQVRAVLSDGVPGDLAECGVWRGGAAVLMRAVLEATGDAERAVWLADSFAGPPPPDLAAFPEDAKSSLWAYPGMGATREEVEATFARHGLLDQRVRFLAGWFRDTLPSAPIDRLALLRVDGALYEATFLALEHLYPRLSPGGIVVVVHERLGRCRRAVQDFRSDHGITEPLEDVDRGTVAWRRSVQSDLDPAGGAGRLRANV